MNSTGASQPLSRLNMELEKQIQTLEEIGFQFRDRKHVDHKLGCYEWWQYQQSPYKLLLEQLNLWAACKQARLCKNLVSWDFKGLRHIGWFKTIAYDLAELSGNQTRLKILNVTESREDDIWEMEYRLPRETKPSRRKIVTRYPHKHASWHSAIEMAEDFETDTHCFINFSNAEPSLCWLPKRQLAKLNEILPGQFKAIGGIIM